MCMRAPRSLPPIMPLQYPRHPPTAFGRSETRPTFSMPLKDAFMVNTHFLIRICVDRLAGDGEHTVADEMDEVRVKRLHRVEHARANALYQTADIEKRRAATK
jgi:hypothetical protein